MCRAGRPGKAPLLFDNPITRGAISHTSSPLSLKTRPERCHPRSSDPRQRRTSLLAINSETAVLGEGTWPFHDLCVTLVHNLRPQDLVQLREVRIQIVVALR